MSLEYGSIQSYNSSANRTDTVSAPYSGGKKLQGPSLFSATGTTGSSKDVEIGKLNNISTWTKYKPGNYAQYLYNRFCSPVYKAVDNKGINGANATSADVCLAKYSKAVADEMTTTGSCYTGVKHALWSAGVIKDYKDMPKGSAHQAKKYFDDRPDQFQKVDVKRDELKNLQAGRIVVYEKENKHGHIAITNGNAQEMSDCTDNMRWLDREGKSAGYSVYKLSDNWEYNEQTKKLEFKGKK